MMTIMMTDDDVSDDDDDDDDDVDDHDNYTNIFLQISFYSSSVSLSQSSS